MVCVEIDISLEFPEKLEEKIVSGKVMSEMSLER